MRGTVGWNRTKIVRMDPGAIVLAYNDAWGTQVLKAHSPGAGIIAAGEYRGSGMRPKQWAPLPIPA